MADELLTEYENELESFTLIPSRGGVFEVWLDDQLIYSKKQTRRHAEAGEVLSLLRDRIGAGQGG